jgi:hypothetical protein
MMAPPGLLIMLLLSGCAMTDEATGSYAFVGSAEGKKKANDFTTDQMLAGPVDQRAGV